MTTFLRTPRMSPELAARVEAAVRGQRVAPGTKLKPRSLSLLRLGLVVGLLVLTSAAARLWYRTQREIAEARAILIERLDREALGLAATQRETPQRVRSWLERCARSSAEDFLAEELRASDGLAKTLARSVLYLRGQGEALTTEPGLRESVQASSLDAFVLCLFDPPPSRTEKSIVSRVRTAHARGRRMQEVAKDVHRLQPALVTLPLLEPTWRDRVLAAASVGELRALERVVERAPFAAARRALDAEVLLFVMDEAPTTSAPAELDGERPHSVRVGLVDLRAERLLLQLRRNVDPAWLSASARAEYAAGADACTLALDVRAALAR